MRTDVSSFTSEMRAVVDVWVDAALRLETRDLRMMARLVKAQDRLVQPPTEEQVIDEVYEVAANA